MDIIGNVERLNTDESLEELNKKFEDALNRVKVQQRERRNLFKLSPPSRRLRPSMVDRAICKQPAKTTTLTTSTPMPCKKKTRFSSTHTLISPINKSLRQERSVSHHQEDNSPPPLPHSPPVITLSSDSSLCGDVDIHRRSKSLSQVVVEQKKNNVEQLAKRLSISVNNGQRMKSAIVQTSYVHDAALTTAKKLARNMFTQTSQEKETQTNKSLFRSRGSSSGSSAMTTFLDQCEKNFLVNKRSSIDTGKPWRATSILNNPSPPRVFTRYGDSEEDFLNEDDTFLPKPKKKRKVFVNKVRKQKRKSVQGKTKSARRSRVIYDDSSDEDEPLEKVTITRRDVAATETDVDGKNMAKKKINGSFVVQHLAESVMVQAEKSLPQSPVVNIGRKTRHSSSKVVQDPEETSSRTTSGRAAKRKSPEKETSMTRTSPRRSSKIHKTKVPQTVVVVATEADEGVVNEKLITPELVSSHMKRREVKNSERKTNKPPEDEGETANRKSRVSEDPTRLDTEEQERVSVPEVGVAVEEFTTSRKRGGASRKKTEKRVTVSREVGVFLSPEPPKTKPKRNSKKNCSNTTGRMIEHEDTIETTVEGNTTLRRSSRQRQPPPVNFVECFSSSNNSVKISNLVNGMSRVQHLSRSRQRSTFSIVGGTLRESARIIPTILEQVEYREIPQTSYTRKSGKAASTTKRGSKSKTTVVVEEQLTEV